MKQVWAVAFAFGLAACATVATKEMRAPELRTRLMIFTKVHQALPSDDQIRRAIIQAMADAPSPAMTPTIVPKDDRIVVTYTIEHDEIGNVSYMHCSSHVGFRSQSDADGVRVTLTPPEILRLGVKSDPVGGTIAKVEGAMGRGNVSDGLLNKAGAACAKELAALWQFKRIAFDYADEVTGEVESEYSDSAVYANFERTLSPGRAATGTRTTDITKVKVFSLEDRGVIATVRISVYPHQRGSKVVYLIRYPYQLRDDGTTTYDQTVIDRLRRRVIAIVNS